MKREKRDAAAERSAAKQEASTAAPASGAGASKRSKKAT